MKFYEPPEVLSGTVFDPQDETFGPIMAAIQAGEFEEAGRLVRNLTSDRIEPPRNNALDQLRDERRRVYKGGAPGYTIRSWVPEKYLLFDTETGDRWEFYLDEAGVIRTRRATEGANHCRTNLTASWSV